MTPCRSVPAASMRHPSMTTSWVAAQIATRKAPRPRRTRLLAGLAVAMSESERATATCVAIIHERLRPMRALRTGTSKRSMSGAQRNFRV